MGLIDALYFVLLMALTIGAGFTAMVAIGLGWEWYRYK